MDPQAPPVVAVVVTADSAGWLEETLEGLAGQDYPNLSVLVIDAGSQEDPTPRIARIMPSAYVRRLPEPVGYAAAANQAIPAVEGASFFLMCHDDVALDPDAVQILVEEAFRSNAGIVAPKLVSWDDPARLLQVGMSADKAGVPVPLANPGEMDQEQHDSVRDVFVAPGGAVLVRADLFVALGGFDAAMVLYGEDLDLSWRAQVAGARVVVAPSARARHRAAASSGVRTLQSLPGLPAGESAAPYLRRRHELRAALKAYGRWHLTRVLPQLVLHSLVEAVVGLLTGHRAAARASVSAWTWNLRHLGELRKVRQVVQTQRRLPDREVRLLQTGGSARLRALGEGLVSRASSRVPHLAIEAIEAIEAIGSHGAPGPPGPPAAPAAPDITEAADTEAAPGRSSPWWPTAVGALLLVLWVFGSRGMLQSGPPAVGQMLPFGSAGHLLAEFTSSVRPAGLGQVSPAPLLLALAGVVSFVLVGSAGLAHTLSVVAMLPLGALGAYRLVRPLGSRPARLLAAVVYLALPLPYADLAAGRWGALVAYAAAPWLLGRLAAASGLEPFATGGQPRWRRWLGLAVLLAVGGAVAPGLALAGVVAGLGLVLASPLVGQWRGALRGLTAAVAGAVGAWLLALPWSAALVSPGAQLAAVLGLRPVAARAAGAGALLSFHPDRGGTDWVGWALLVGMAMPLFFGRQWRLAWGARLWSVALACWLLAWAVGRGWLGAFSLDPGVLLAVGGAALTLSAALGVVAFETDLIGYGLSWRQLLPVLGAVGLGVGAVGAIGHVGDGRWGAPGNDFRTVLAALPGHGARTGFEVLWVGDPQALPGGGWRYAPGVAYTTSRGGSVPDVSYDWLPPDSGPAARAARDLHLAQDGLTGHVGQALAGLGVRYVLVPTGDAPGGTALSPPPALVQTLDDQFDLAPVNIDPSLLVFQNTDWKAGDGLRPPHPNGDWRGAQLGFEALLWVLALAALGRSRRAGRDEEVAP